MIVATGLSLRNEKAMARQINWYMNGWEYHNTKDKHGKNKRVLTYKGVYYSFNLSARGLAALKACYLALALALYMAFILYSTGKAKSGGALYSGFPGMMTIIPFIYLGMGVFCLLLTKRNMTYRAYYASIKRITYSNRIALALMGVSILGRIIYTAVNFSAGTTDLRPELFGFSYGGACIALIGGLLFLSNRFPAVIVGKKGGKSNGKQ